MGAVVRVTIEHREATGGVTGSRRDYYIDCTVHFSEEERAIIKARDLYREGISVRAATPPPSKVALGGNFTLFVIGPPMVIGGLLYGLFGEGLAGIKTNVAVPILVIGLACTFSGFVRFQRGSKRAETPEQTITVGQLLSTPTLTVYATNPASAKGIEEGIREKLTYLKNLISNSADVSARRTFEL
jgi:hypothetical protein